MKKFVLSVVAVFLITAGTAGVASAESSHEAVSAPKSAGPLNTWF
ncbi:hypothetical protein [Streptomyces marincola]|nr:hypothetical protein [Streptomyces marincola]